MGASMGTAIPTAAVDSGLSPVYGANAKHRHATAHALPYSFSLLLGVFAVIALLRLIALALNATDLFTDEAQYWSWSRDLAFGYFSKPPLIAWIIAATEPVCGDSEYCVRLPSVFIHLATSLVVYLIGRRLVSERAGFWSAITFATLPGISLSSGIISTDVPLLFAWAVALMAFAELVIVPSISMAIMLGLALGIGLNAKYAMAYFLVCAAVFFLIAPERRAILRQPHLPVSLAIAAALIVPNVLWNAGHGFATFSHTADNANWSGSLFHPEKALEFVVSQFGVFGPILFAALIVSSIPIARTLRNSAASGYTTTEKLLFAFCVPIIVLIATQALLSRSLANWAAPAYVAGTLLVVSLMIREGSWAWLRASLAVNALIGLGLAAATALAPYVALPNGEQPFARTLGNRELAEAIREGLVKNAARDVHFGALLTDDRDTAAALLYYGRNIPLPVYAWRATTPPRHHFELKQPFTADVPGPVLLISRRADGSRIPARFRHALALGEISVPAGIRSERQYHLFELDGLKRQ